MRCDIVSVYSSYRGIARTLTISDFKSKRAEKNFNYLMEEYFAYLEDMLNFEESEDQKALERTLSYYDLLESYDIPCEVIVYDLHPLESAFGRPLTFLGIEIVKDMAESLMEYGAKIPRSLLNEHLLCKSVSDVPLVTTYCDTDGLTWLPCRVYCVNGKSGYVQFKEGNMISYQLAEALDISKGNLRYYVARYANHLDWCEDDKNDLARIVLFRKLGFPHFWIRSLRKGKHSIREAFKNCPRAKKRMIEADQQWLQKWRWEELPFGECAALIHKNVLPTPDQDVIFWGRLLERKVIAVVLGVFITGISFALRDRWETCKATLLCLSLVPVYGFIYAILDNWIWRKRSKNAKTDRV